MMSSNLSIPKSLNSLNAATKRLALLLHGQQTLLDGIVRDGMDQVAQGHPRLHLAAEAHQNL